LSPKTITSTKQSEVTKLKLEVDPSLNKEEREELANRVLGQIYERTDAGRKPTGGKFPKYTKEYAKEKGVSRSDVDLQLSEKMLRGMRQLKSSKYDKKGLVTVGFKKGQLIERRAEGNILGSYGGNPDKKKARPFLGISQKFLDKATEDILAKREKDQEAGVEKTDEPSLVFTR
jgi:hypothetical protein